MGKFKSGDLVVLKSGGPVMTVTPWRTDACHCIWFVRDELHQEAFKPEMLEFPPPKQEGAT